MSKLYLGDYKPEERTEKLIDFLKSLTLGDGNVAKVRICYEIESKKKDKAGVTHQLRKQSEGEYLLGCDYNEVKKLWNLPDPKNPNRVNPYKTIFGKGGIVKEYNGNNAKNIGKKYLTIYRIKDGEHSHVLLRKIDGQPVTKEQWEVVNPIHPSTYASPSPVFTVEVKNIISIE